MRAITVSFAFVLFVITGCDNDHKKALIEIDKSFLVNPFANLHLKHKISQKNTNSAKINGELKLKEITVGVKLDSYLIDKLEDWTYYNKKRKVKYELLNNKVIAKIGFQLNNYDESYSIQANLTEKFKKEGNLNFKFYCVSSSTKGSLVTTYNDNCYAYDSSNTLLIKRVREELSGQENKIFKDESFNKNWTKKYFIELYNSDLVSIRQQEIAANINLTEDTKIKKDAYDDL